MQRSSFRAPRSVLGHKRTWRGQFVMSALPPKADIRPRDQDVCFGPNATLEQLFDYLVGRATNCPTAMFQAADTSLRQIVNLSSWLQSRHRKIRTSDSPPCTGTTAIKCISVLQRQLGTSVEPGTSTRSSFDMIAPPENCIQPTGAVTGALVLKRHSHGLCASQYRLQGTKGCLPTCWLACCKPEAAVSPSEITACYRLYAACCAEIARRASDQRRRARLLNLAQVCLRLVQSVRRQTGVSGPAMPRLPTQRAEIVT